MTRKEYLVKLESVSINNDVVHCVEAMCGLTLPTMVKQMLSFSKESVFFDDEFRTLSLAEILDAQADLHVDFKDLGLIPVVDCGENDFIVYHTSDDSWSKYNIVDETIFKKRPQLKDLF
ncbi:hypothetical protein [uncultured Oscillibacter sp.]|uniref:hypothetical protein n=1 Tax=uncultured Oscillibacter sp. TaxID=876091 RepID=UPI00260E67A1|nr:hypothetical protein [uncultured Oscillibacter sp.]